MIEPNFEIVSGGPIKVQDPVTGISLQYVPPIEGGEIILSLRAGARENSIGIWREKLQDDQRTLFRLVPASVDTISRITKSPSDAARLTDIVAAGVRVLAPYFARGPFTVLIPDDPT